MTTKDDIQTSINLRLTSKPTLIEGGTIQDVVGSVSYELANIIDTKINVILDNAFVTTCDEEHLLIKGSELGIDKKESTNSVVVAHITEAQENFEIPETIQAKTDTNIIFQTVSSNITNENGEAYVVMKCLSEGLLGNIEAGELNEFCSTYIGLESASITNEERANGGYDEESVEEYRERILEYMRDDACNSNIADYTMWAKSVSGVQNVVVEDATIAGAGCVRVYISAQNDAEVSENLINNVAEYIKSKQIINADLFVLPLNYKPLNISANVVLRQDTSVENVLTEFKRLLKNYLTTKPSLVSYLYISNLLFEVDGIEDVSNYLLNNDNKSIEIQKLEVPAIGTIALNTEGE